MNTWQPILTAIASAILTSGLLNIYFNHRNNQKLEKQRAEQMQQNFRFTETFKKTAEVIDTIYKKLRAFKTAVENSIGQDTGNDNEHSRKSMIELESLRQDFYKYFLVNKIYLPK